MLIAEVPAHGLTAAPFPTTSSMTAQPKINVAEQVTLADLLDDPILGDLTVRFVANAKKVINNVDDQLSDETIELEMDISRIYFDIGHARRSEAFANGRSPAQRLPGAFENVEPAGRTTPVVIELAPKPEPKPEPKYAPHFTTERACAMLKVALKNRGSGSSVTFAQLKVEVEELHLGEDEVWRDEELKVQSNNLKCWENRIQNELGKLRKADVIHYRATKGDYFIF